MSSLCQDITFCMSHECKRKFDCFRYVGCKKMIASYSDFLPVCEDNDYSLFIQADDIETEAYKTKKGITEE